LAAHPQQKGTQLGQIEVTFCERRVAVTFQTTAPSGSQRVYRRSTKNKINILEMCPKYSPAHTGANANGFQT